MQGRPLPLTGTGDETRDFTYVADHVEGLLLAGSEVGAENQSFDLGTGVETRMVEIAKLVNELTSNSAGVEFKEARRWDRQSRRVADTKRAGELIGFKARVPLETGLIRTVAWFREEWPRIQRRLAS
jgi:nucleoside-diphosphate-sugar epimerase